MSSIAQTGDGYLWIGTDKSLIRFDGLDFEVFPRAIPSALAIGAVQSLIADGRGNLWILLPTTKLLRYHDEIFDAVGGQVQNGITAMAAGAGRATLISSVSLGMLSYNGTEFVSQTSPDLRAKTHDLDEITNEPHWRTQAWSTGLKPHSLAGPAPGVISIAATVDDEIWLGTEDGELFHLKERRLSQVGHLAGAAITSILPVGHSEVWIGTTKGLLRWDGTRLTSAGVPSALKRLEVLSLIRDRDANIWVGTKQLLVRMNSAVDHLQVSVIPAHFGPVRALLEDREGNIWIGGAGGLERLRDSPFVTYPMDGPGSQSTGAIYVDAANRTWVAPLDGGLRWLRGEKQERVKAAGLERDIVYSIAGGQKNELWLGRQRGGLTSLRFGDNLITTRTYSQADGLSQNSVFSVYRGRDGTIWSGTLSGGVSALRDGHFTTYTTENGLASNTVSSIAEGVNGTMWFGTPNGVSRLSNNHWQTYSVKDGLRSADVNCVLMGSTGVLWVGTGAGLASLKDGRILAFQNMPDSLHEPVFGIVEDGRGKLWIATANHILQVSPSGPERNLLQASDTREYAFSDGLQGKEGVKRFRSVIADSRGQVWFSTNHGLSVVNLPRGADHSPPALVHIARVSADGDSFNLQRPLRVPPAKARITLRFVGLSLKSPERVRYSYRLDGFDRGWSEPTTNREATYDNLRPGTYRFHVLASNSDGSWNGQEATIEFEVEPTLLQTWWFRAALVLSAALLSLAIYRLRVHQLTGLLNIRFEERLAERTRIAQELHDTLLQSFQGLILRFQAANQVLLAKPAEAKEALERALDRADLALRDSRRAIQGIRHESLLDLNIDRALSALMNELAADSYLAEETRPTTSVIVEGQPRRIEPGVCEEVYKIAREALRNAFTHGKAHHIESEILFSRDFLRVRFRDDGVGISQPILEAGARAGHWGLVGMKERARGLRGHLSIWSKPGAGTEVEVAIPASTAFKSAASWRRFKMAGRETRSDT